MENRTEVVKAVRKWKWGASLREFGSRLDKVGERSGWYDRTGKRSNLEDRMVQQGEAGQTKKVKEKIC